MDGLFVKKLTGLKATFMISTGLLCKLMLSVTLCVKAGALCRGSVLHLHDREILNSRNVVHSELDPDHNVFIDHVVVASSP